MTGRGSKVSTHRYPDGANGTSPEHGALARREDGLLVPEKLTGNPAAAEPQDCGDIPEATMGTGGPDERETEVWDQNGQQALLGCGHPEDADVERGPSGQQRALNACSHQGGGGGWSPHPEARSSHAQPGEGGGHPNQAVHSPSAQPGDGGGRETPHTVARASCTQPGDRGGHPNRAERSPSARLPRAARGERGTP